MITKCPDEERDRHDKLLPLEILSNKGHNDNIHGKFFKMWFLLHNKSLLIKLPRDSVVVMIEKNNIFTVLTLDFRHKSDEISYVFSFD